MINIGIVGYGFVGKALHALFDDSHKFNVIIYDPNINNYSSDLHKDSINSAHYAFVCVPTPCNDDGSCDTSIIKDAISWIKSDIVIIRSTIPPGTTKSLYDLRNKIVFQPEYIGETIDHPLIDHHSHGFVIIGSESKYDAQRVAELYKTVFNSNIKFYFTDSTTAELCKYMENSFFAAKVMFCNEFYSMAENFGVNYDELRELWLADPRVNRDHTFVYNDNRGFSGKCLPKDVSAIISKSKEEGYKPKLLEALMNINAEYRKDDSTYSMYRDIYT